MLQHSSFGLNVTHKPQGQIAHRTLQTMKGEQSLEAKRMKR